MIFNEKLLQRLQTHLLSVLFCTTAQENYSQDASGPIVLTIHSTLELATGFKINDFWILHLQGARVKFNSGFLHSTLNTTNIEHLCLAYCIINQGGEK